MGIMEMAIASTVKGGHRPSCPLPKNKLLPIEKPLPSPPVMQVSDAESMGTSRHLLDATEKPLRRSPTGTINMDEEWPALSPQKIRPLPRIPPTVPEHDVTEEAVTSEPRFPSRVFSDPTHNSPSSSARRGKGQHTAIPKLVVESSSHDCKIRPTSRLDAERGRMDASEMSAGAAALEKASVENPQYTSHPRQTRTSSLRARISAGSLSTNGRASNNRVVGFTDFTSMTGSTEPNEVVVSSTSIKHRISDISSAPHGRILTRGDVRLNGHAPAKIVAGSRRPEFARPSSRSSNRSSVYSTASIPARERVAPRKAQRPKTPISGTLHEQSVSQMGLPDLQVKKRGSNSINLDKISRREPSVVDGTSRRDAAATVAECGMLHDPFKIFEDSLRSVNRDVNSHSVHGLQQSHQFETDIDGNRIKRLSKEFPDEGPILTISPDADRIIMGETKAVKENEHPIKVTKKTRNLHKSVVTRELRKAARDADARPLAIKSGRPHSIDSHSVLSLERGASPAARQRKALSADAKTLLLLCGNKDPFVDVGAPTNTILPRGSTPEQMIPGTTEALEGSPTAIKQPIQAAELDGHQRGPSISLIPGTIVGRSKRASSKSPIGSAFPSTTIQEYLATRRVSPTTDHERFLENSTGSSPYAITVPVKNPDEVRLPFLTNKDTIHSVNGTKEFVTPPKQILIEDLPLRSSSRVAAAAFITGGPPTKIRAENIQEASGSAKDYARIANVISSSYGEATNLIPIGHHQSITSAVRQAQSLDNIDIARLDSIEKRASKATATSKCNSKGSSSPKKPLFINTLRGLFGKNASNSGKSSRLSNSSSIDADRSADSTPLSVVASTPGNSNYLSARSTRSYKSFPVGNSQITEPVAPTECDVIVESTSLAMQIITSARNEADEPTKERLLEMGKVMVDAITNARDAEKAMEQAKGAANRAEMACVMTRKSLLDVGRLIEEWKGDI